MRRSAIIFSFLLFLSFISSAQEKQKLFNWTHAGVYGEYGVRFYDLDEFNKMLSDSGYSTLSNQQDYYGFGFTGRTEKIIFQLNYYRFSQCEVSDHQTCSHLEHNTFGFAFGYNFLKVEKDHLYPLIGFYKSKSQILISNNALPVQPFATYLTANHNISQAVRHNYMLHLGAGYDHFFSLGEKYSSELFIGIRGGYYLDLDKNYWEIHEEIELTDEPELKLGGTYFSGTIGFTF